MKNPPRLLWGAGLALGLLLSQGLAFRPLWAAFQSLSTFPSGLARPMLLLALVAGLHLLLGTAAVLVYRRSRQLRHWHPGVGRMSSVAVLSSGELNRPVSSYIQPYARRAPNSRVG